MNDVHDQPFIDHLFVDLCERLLALDIPLRRSSMHFRTLNPQWLRARFLWSPGMVSAELVRFQYGVEETSDYLNSPVMAISETANEIRRDLENYEPAAGENRFWDELKSSGHTDYVAWPLRHTFGKRHVVSFATDRPGGFRHTDIEALRGIVPALSLVSEIRLKNILARTYLETYVGLRASKEILAGATTRGTGSTVSAAIMICDMRDFTAISDVRPRDEVIELLNSYFDAFSGPIEKHGGEILKFVGDGLLAIFPLDKTDACVNLMRSIEEATSAIENLNLRRLDQGLNAVRYGIGVHVGDVMYGNIGSTSRLDFTVIGPAVNIASRLEEFTKELKRPVLLSKAFVDMAGQNEELENLGFHPLRGLGEAVEVFGIKASSEI